MDHSLQLAIPFPSERLATIAMRVLDVDKELKANAVKRTLATQDATLTIRFECDQLKTLRVVVTSFFDMLTMVTRTMHHFDQASV